jgi:hypothetical protein
VKAFLRPGTDTSIAKRHSLVEQFKQVDLAYPARNNENLTDVMLAGCIAHAIDMGGTVGTAAALALKTMTISGTARSVEPPELVEGSLEFLKLEGGRVREEAHDSPDSLPAIRPISPAKSVSLAVEDIADNGWDAVRKNDKAIATAITDLQKSFTSVTKTTQDLQADTVAALSALDRQQRDPAILALQEETQILWWLFGAWSDDTKSPFSSLRLPGASLTLAAELARFTRFLPGHPRGASILAKAIASCEGDHAPVTLVNVVSNISAEWWKGAASLVNVVDGTTPVVLAINRSAEAPGDSWQPAFETVTGLSSTHTRTPVEWATQFCDEILLQRMLNDAKT